MLPFISASSDKAAAVPVPEKQQHCCSMTVPVPFFCPTRQPSPVGAPVCDATAHDLMQQQQQQQEQQQEEQVFALMEAVIHAPANLRLYGWQSQADSPEEREDREGCMCLLACMQGHFLPVEIQSEAVHEASQGTEGIPIRVIQVRKGGRCETSYGEVMVSKQHNVLIGRSVF